MQLDEYRAGFAHRTRSNMPQGAWSNVQAGGASVVTPGPAVPSQAECRHRAVRELSVAGRLIDRQCIDCGKALPDREWED